MRITSTALLFLMLAPVLAVRADDTNPGADAPGSPASSAAPKLGEADVQKWKVGMIVSASGGPVARLTGTTTIPMDWPEQSVKIADQDLSPGLTLGYKSYGTAKQMVVGIPRIADGKEVHAFLILEVTRHTLLPPDETDSLVVPKAKSLPPEFKAYLGPSPLIESTHARIKEIAGKLAEGQAKAWPHVRAIYDWVRKTIEYEKDAPLTGCIEAIDKGKGDCNELTSTFIAICRASGIPARTVRIPGHCYPEFYLEDAQGQGHWYPAEASGSEAFGGIRTHTPIMQKGDALRASVAHIEGGRLRTVTETVRFLPENLTSMNLKAGGRPAMKLVCEPAE